MFRAREVSCAIPLFAQARFNFRRDDTGRGVPFILLNAGNNFHVAGDVRVKGLMYEANLGYAFPMGGKTFFTVTCGYGSMRWYPLYEPVGERKNAFMVRFGVDW